MGSSNTRYRIQRKFTHSPNTRTAEFLDTATRTVVLKEIKEAISGNNIRGVLIVDIQSKLFQVIGTDKDCFTDLIEKKYSDHTKGNIFDVTELED